tara:strand:- start:102 stop:392 length:291 start_codon:yes stop_codon:yes gene_type:complete
MMWAEQFSQTPAGASFTDQLSQARDLVYDLRSPDLDGDMCYYILKIDPACHDRFLTALEHKLSFNMSDYGELLHFGRGEPDADLQSELRQKYGMYH